MITVRSSSDSPSTDAIGASAATGAASCVASFVEGSSTGRPRDTDPSVMRELTTIVCPQRRHFMRTVLPATFSSPIWYFALQLSQRNFIGGVAALAR